MTDLVERLRGRWLATASAEHNLGVAEVVIEPGAEQQILVRLRIVGAEGPAMWGPIACRLYECGEEDHVASAAALGVVTLDEMTVELQLRVNKGILCVMSWTTFADGRRHPWVTRELFARAIEPPFFGGFFGGFFGVWDNTDLGSKGVVSLAFRADADGRTFVRAWAAASEGVVDLGESPEPIELFGGAANPTPLAFSAWLPDRVLLQGNINRGLMILAAYRCIDAAHPLAGRFSREFYGRRRTERTAERTIVPGALFDAFACARAPAIDDFVGRWQNADPSSSLPTLDITAEGDDLLLSIQGDGERLPARWPRARARAFAYFDELGHDTMLLLGSVEHDGGRSDLQIKVVQGTGVIAAFHSRKHGSWFTREFFRRA